MVDTSTYLERSNMPSVYTYRHEGLMSYNGICAHSPALCSSNWHLPENINIARSTNGAILAVDGLGRNILGESHRPPCVSQRCPYYCLVPG